MVARVILPERSPVCPTSYSDSMLLRWSREPGFRVRQETAPAKNGALRFLSRSRVIPWPRTAVGTDLILGSG